MSSSPLTEKPYVEDLPRSTGASVVVSGRYLPPPEDKDGKLWVRTSALVLKDAQVLYAMWRDVEAAPQWQEHLVEVVETGPGTSRWSMRTSNDDDSKVITWESEVLADEPGVRIAWRSIGGDVDQAGEVIFDAAPNGVGTVVTVLQEFRMGKLASAWETLVGRNPKQAVIENLRHFKALAETGEIPRSQLDPHGDRGVIGNFKRSSYGETVPTPTGGN
ncbi:putative membrane protein [Granulicella aggregans]|uniref:Putative membrane protein n=1 Tax=Granulicella aggregans TaxID=474949 RepID=A0A7W7ZE58_9BACT|nr:SRPBCC family protein [Granulicella aggregans]MBB5058132.1 putative membrane protein [Granulicella aggregans]